jgi:REP element-mobilizing transposase RayT
MRSVSRKSLRISLHDYRKQAVYMITIVTADRHRIFGEVIDGQMRLSSTGIVARDLWLRTAEIRPYVRLDEFIIMPDHMHAIIWIADDLNNFGFSRYATCFADKSRIFGGQSSRSLSAIIGTYKAAVTRLVRALSTFQDFRVWQGNYHELIIRDQAHLLHYQEYIQNNPKNWRN